MTERPILFNGEMVRSILDGSKTQTRRVMKPQASTFAPSPIRCHELDEGGYGFFDEERDYKSPYGKPGDRLWVRETHYVFSAGYKDGRDRHIVYRATEPDAPCGWTPSIHMPRWASRITLEVVSVRVERVQDISEADAASEGTPILQGGNRTEFRMLWDSINAKRGYGWDANPWVWVIEFSVQERQGND